MKDKKCFVFDLDDTLICELDYLKSAFYEIANLIAPNDKVKEVYQNMLEYYKKKLNVFEEILNDVKNPKFNTEKLVTIYRNHYPLNIEMKENAFSILQNIKNEGYYLGLVSDGRSVTQRNKLKASKIENLFDLIIISEEFGSEKPSLKNFEMYNNFKTIQKYYIADNVKKDFLAPNNLGWETICLLDDGNNIHLQNFNLSNDYLPKYKIKKLNELIKFI